MGKARRGPPGRPSPPEPAAGGATATRTGPGVGAGVPWRGDGTRGASWTPASGGGRRRRTARRNRPWGNGERRRRGGARPLGDRRWRINGGGDSMVGALVSSFSCGGRGFPGRWWWTWVPPAPGRSFAWLGWLAPASGGCWWPQERACPSRGIKASDSEHEPGSPPPGEEYSAVAVLGNGYGGAMTVTVYLPNQAITTKLGRDGCMEGRHTLPEGSFIGNISVETTVSPFPPPPCPPPCPV